jgi:tetratricopeptide (TPR) repeat protein
MASTGATIQTSAEEWLLLKVGMVPKTSVGWFRAGIAFYNKKDFVKAIECFEKSVTLDPLNVIFIVRTNGSFMDL